MNSTCPYTHVSYSTWRLQIFRRLCTDIKPETRSRLSFLHPRSLGINHERRQHFHESTKRARSNVKDVKRSARFKTVQLELAKRAEPGTVDAKSSTSSLTPAEFVNERANNQWTPYSEESLEQIQNLVGELQAMTKRTVPKNSGEVEEDGVPFEFGSKIYARRKPGQSESPLERRLPWNREKKRQVQDVETDKRLESNVWAQMLASPLRLDRGTKARLPKDLMTAWGVMQNPENEKDYLLPLELSDLESFRQSLQQEANTDDTRESLKSQEQHPKFPGDQQLSGTRVQIAPSKTLLQAMTGEFTDASTKSSGNKVPSASKTYSGKILGAIIPYRWRHKQDELEAFHRTRKHFNESLQRKPDEDEPDLTQLAKLDKLQWQSDITERIERIMAERILVALEAVGRDNATGRAVHDKRVSALPIPTDCLFDIDERGRLKEGRASKSATSSVLSDASPDDGSQSNPDWLHGAIFLHIGTPTMYLNTIGRWHQPYHESKPTDLIPPLITINNQINLPVFNLSTLLDQTNPTRIRDTITSQEVLTLKYWQQRARNQYENPNQTHLTDRPPGSESPLDMGEQVLSSIITPTTNTPVPSPTATPPSTTSTSIDSEQENERAQVNKDEYLILIKPRARHADVLVREIWNLWRYLGGRVTLNRDR